MAEKAIKAMQEKTGEAEKTDGAETTDGADEKTDRAESDITLERIQLGRDDRVVLDTMTSPPYNWICAIKYSKGSTSLYGTGFKINFPHVNYSVVLTAAHVIWDEKKKEKPRTVTLKFPGEPSFEVDRNNFYKPDEYKSENDENHDYGLIFYRNGRTTTSDGFGWTTQISDGELQRRIVTVCGFPLDAYHFSPQIQDLKMSITGGEITNVKQYRLEYVTDTMGGQSGSPIYTWYQGYWTVVGIHTTGTVGHNSGRRLDLQVIARFARVMDCQKALQSVRNTQAHFRCKPHGGVSYWGSVKCQYGAPGNFEKFYIYPVAMPPSLATADILPQFVIESVYHKYWLLYMDYYYRNKSYEKGAGTMYIHYSSEYKVGKKEQFYLKREDENDVYSFICVNHSHNRIRVDATNVKKFHYSGSGTVNCQYYDSPRSTPTKDNPYVEKFGSSYDNARSWEKIKIVPC